MIFLVKTKKTNAHQLLAVTGTIEDNEGLKLIFKSEDKRKPSYTVVIDESSRERIKEMLK